jgi:carbamoyltransferase
MAELDRALFHGGMTRRWSASELADLSTEGGRFKETSRLFPEDGFVAPLRTELGLNAVLMVDPIGESTLADPTERQPPLQLERERVELLLSLLHEPTDGGAHLRRTLCLSHRELRTEVGSLQRDIARFGLTATSGWLDGSDPVDHPLAEPAEQTLAPFSDPDFRSDETLTDFASALERHGFTESAVAAELGVESLQQIEPTHLYWHANHQLPESPLADLIRVFLLRASRPRPRMESLLGAGVLARLIDLGILTVSDDAILSAVDLFCSGGMFFATDHRYMLLADDKLDEEPVMYIGMDSHGLVQTAPRTVCDRLLDLCCGSGIQGIVASRYAARVVAVDLNPRAVRFARFNARLNGLKNYEVRLGSVYEPVEGERFDVVLANPPFVPSPEMGLAFRDGGVRGEAILRKIVSGAVEHLTPMGRLCIVTDLVDVETYPEKLGRWWGPESMEGLILKTADRDEMLFSVPHCHAPFGQSVEAYNRELDRWVTNFRSAEIDGVNFGYLLVWRGAVDTVGGVTARVIHNPSQPMYPEVDDWLDQRRRWHLSDAARLFVCLHPGARLMHEHGPGGSEPTYSLSVPGSDFFTTYTLSARVYEELCHIARTSPQLGEVGTTGDGWLRELHRLGLVRLETAIPSTPAETQLPVSLDVVEQATKTTPTCLSSYLA